jgi:hypothetical protein
MSCTLQEELNARISADMLLGPFRAAYEFEHPNEIVAQLECVIDSVDIRRLSRAVHEPIPLSDGIPQRVHGLVSYYPVVDVDMTIVLQQLGKVIGDHGQHRR